MVRAVVALDYKTSLDRFQRDLLALKATGGLISKNNEHESLSTSRSDHMHAVAAGSAKVGVWKVGDKHAEDMEKKGPRYTVTRAKDFDGDVKATFGEVGQTPEEFEFELGRRVTSGFGPSDPTAPYHSEAPSPEGSQDSSRETSGASTPKGPTQEDEEDDGTEEEFGGGAHWDPFVGGATGEVNLGSK